MRLVKGLFVFAILLALALAGWLAYFALHPLSLPRTPFDFTVRTGAGLKAVSRQLANDGLFPEGESLWVLARLMGKAPTVQAGTYRLDAPITPLELLDKLSRGDVMLVEMRFLEGTTFRQWLGQLARQSQLRQTLGGKTAADVAALLEVGHESPEGWLFPDTYRFAPGVSDIELLKRAHGAMKKRLDAAWSTRAPEVPLATPYEALIMASIVEKETGAAAERPLIASVFYNRIRKGMRLQTDPTVIYGMGEKYDGNIRKRDLTTDTPWNTYTRDGLPPTPIAMPGGASLDAVSRPAQTEFLYFVGKGDGTHQFSRTLEEHNRAVAKYQLGK
ncbi:MAG TPA: endolytic transglycosylase MltG [Usitatibacter sp.]|nr:endolytic transglycosylase MltG [Usitatibacter sp.]